MKTIILVAGLLAASPAAADTIAHPSKTLAAMAYFDSIDPTGCVTSGGLVIGYRLTPLYGGQHDAVHEIQVDVVRIDACNGTVEFADGSVFQGDATLDGDVTAAGVHADIPVTGWADATSVRVDVEWDAIGDTCYQGMSVERFGGPPFESFMFRLSGTTCAATAAGSLAIGDFAVSEVTAASLADGNRTVVVGEHGPTIIAAVEGGGVNAYNYDATGCEVTYADVSFDDTLRVYVQRWNECTGEGLLFGAGETETFVLDDGHLTGAFDDIAVDLTFTPVAGSCDRLLRVVGQERTMQTSCSATVTGTLQVAGSDISLDGGAAFVFEDRNGPP